jgi:chaperonin GroES
MALPELYPIDDLEIGEGEAAPEEQQAPHPLEQLTEWAKRPNIIAELDKDVVSAMAARVLDEYQIDKSSRADWEKEAQLAMDAVLQKPEQKNYPFEKASNIKYPILTNAALQFGARSYPAMVPGNKVVKVEVVGPDPMGLKQARSDRVGVHMSYQILKEMDAWEDETDTMCHQLPVLGDGFKKVYRDVENGKNCSDFISAMNVVVNQNTKSLQTVPRITHEIELYPYQIEERIRGGTFAKFEYGSAGTGGIAKPDGNTDSPNDTDAPHVFLEQHRFEDLDGDKLREPWVVTIHKDSGICVRVVANYDLKRTRVREDGVIVRIPRRDYFVHFPFLPDPNGGFYGVGFGRLLRSIGEAVNTSLNQIIDAAHLQNAGGGWLGSGMNLKKAQLRIAMNEWTQLNVPGKNIRDAIVPHNFPGPSPVLFQVLGMLIDAGKQIASVQDVLTGDAHAQTMQPTTLLALIEQGLKVFTSIIKRLFRSLAREFQLLYELNREYPDEEAYQRIIDWSPPPQVLQAVEAFKAEQQKAMMGHNGGPPLDGQAPASPGGEGMSGGAPDLASSGAAAAQLPGSGGEGADPGAGGGGVIEELPPQLAVHLERPTMAGDYEYENCDIVPVADPSQVTDMQKMAKAQIIEANMGHPNMNKEQGLRRILVAANIEEVDALVISTPEGPDPMQAANLEAEVMKKKAGAMKDIALGEKASVETHAIMQGTAIEHAQVSSGALDDDRALEAEIVRLQKLKDDREYALKVRQQEIDRKATEKTAKGEAA